MPVIDISMGGSVSSRAARRRSARLQRRENARQSLQGQEIATQPSTGQDAEAMSGSDTTSYSYISVPIFLGRPITGPPEHFLFLLHE